MDTKFSKLPPNTEIPFSELTGKKTDAVIILKGNLSEAQFTKYCETIKRAPPYEVWEITFLVVDKNGVDEVYIIHPFYGKLSTRAVLIDAELETPYDVTAFRVKKTGADAYTVYAPKGKTHERCD